MLVVLLWMTQSGKLKGENSGFLGQFSVLQKDGKENEER